MYKDHKTIPKIMQIAQTVTSFTGCLGAGFVFNLYLKLVVCLFLLVRFCVVRNRFILCQMCSTSNYIDCLDPQDTKFDKLKSQSTKQIKTSVIVIMDSLASKLLDCVLDSASQAVGDLVVDQARSKTLLLTQAASSHSHPTTFSKKQRH